MFAFPAEQVMEWALIFIRVSAIIFALPIFGDEPITVRVRILLSVAISFAIVPVVSGRWVTVIPTEMIAFAVLVIKEAVIGLVIGFAAKIMFDGLVRAASICGYQMGFGTAHLMMPTDTERSTAFDGFHRIIVIMIFLTLGLHHVFLSAIFETFSLIPLGHVRLPSQLATIIIQMVTNLFIVTLKLAAPILVSLSFTMAAMGLVARTVPQMNVFTLSFPVSFFVGLIVYIGCLPLFPGWILDTVGESGKESLFAIIKMMAPR